MRRYVDYCFYGLLLIFLDLNFNGQVGQVDLLSDALGIWLVSYGLSERFTGAFCIFWWTSFGK